jgi:hypothetical protein
MSDDFAGAWLLSHHASRPLCDSAQMMADDAEFLAEADQHVIEAHQLIRRQKEFISELALNNQNTYASCALLSVLTLLVYISERQRQQLLTTLRSD